MTISCEYCTNFGPPEGRDCSECRGTWRIEVEEIDGAIPNSPNVDLFQKTLLAIESGKYELNMSSWIISGFGPEPLYCFASAVCLESGRYFHRLREDEVVGRLARGMPSMWHCVADSNGKLFRICQAAADLLGISLSESMLIFLRCNWPKDVLDAGVSGLTEVVRRFLASRVLFGAFWSRGGAITDANQIN